MSTVETVRVMDALHDGGEDVQARFIGGCVRDALLGKEVRDIDIATRYYRNSTYFRQRIAETDFVLPFAAVLTTRDHFPTASQAFPNMQAVGRLFADHANETGITQVYNSIIASGFAFNEEGIRTNSRIFQKKRKNVGRNY